MTVVAATDAAGPFDLPVRRGRVVTVFGDASTAERLLALYSDMDRTLLEATRDGDTVRAVTQLAVAAVPGVEQASISEGREGRFHTLASTGDIASTGDRIQYQLGTGPCVDAMIEDTVYRTGDIAGEPRWGEFGSRAHRETGVVSMLSLRLFLEDDDRIAGLNLYSTQPDAFDDDAQFIATVVATHTATALIAAAAKQRAANLERALTSNRQIGMAMGILMASRKLTDDDAFALLRIASQNANRKLTDVADDVIQTGTLELPHLTTGPTGRQPRARRPGP
jgi:GAF domain-containing protein